ncbi:MAG: ABC transporter permease [Chitinophagaceae bacterium]|nr:ABC transporter permease [Chitinophagaceae bacterium]
MFRNYLKIAWRSLLKDRQSTILNLIGLSTGLACTLLIYLWVSDELSFDRSFQHDSQLYQLMERRNWEGAVGVSDESSGLLAATVAREMPQVEYAATVAPSGWFPKFTLSVGEKVIKASGQYAGKDYFNIFSLRLLEGNKDQVLADKRSIVISEELARELFNTTRNLIGRMIRVQHDQEFRITGVFETPAHWSEHFDFVQSFDFFKDYNPWVTEWGNTGPHNYVLLREGTDIRVFNRQIGDIITHSNGDTSRKAFASRYSDMYLKYGQGTRAGGRIEYVRLFSIVAAFILVIACINFMNLSTAKASRRLKEVGVKKVIGASRIQLIWQFLSESILLSLFSLGIALLLVALLLPAFNQLTGKDITLHMDVRLTIAALSITLVTGLIAGSYPAFYLSRFRPILVLKGKLNTSFGELFARKGLVVFQFTLSMIFIVAVLVVFQQMKYIQSKNLGYNKDNVLVFNSDGKLLGNQETFLAELKRLPGVAGASGTTHNLIGHNFSTPGLEWEGRDPRQNTLFEVAGIEYDFLETMGVGLAGGRGFAKNYHDEPEIIINQTAVKAMGIKDPVGKTVKLWGQNKQIIGVIKDFHFESLHEPVKPMILLPQNTDSNSRYKILTRIQAGRETEVIAWIRKLYQSFNPGYIFDYRFLDEAYQKQYESEQHVGALSKYFAGLAILISCLGLFGLAAFTTQRRQKEIGVRKVVGASTEQIALMLSMGFLRLVGLAILIAFPIAWWVMNQWLHSFVYRIPLGAGVFGVAGASVIFIALLTVSFQSIRAAVASPVKNLKTE